MSWRTIFITVSLFASGVVMLLILSSMGLWGGEIRVYEHNSIIWAVEMLWAGSIVIVSIRTVVKAVTTRRQQ